MKTLQKIVSIALLVSLSIVATSTVHGGKWSRAAESLSGAFERSKRVNLDNTTAQQRDAFFKQQRALEEEAIKARKVEADRLARDRTEQIKRDRVAREQAERIAEQKRVEALRQQEQMRLKKQLTEQKLLEEKRLAKLPTGQSGSPITVNPRSNTSGHVDGRHYSGHAFDQMQGRGVPPSVVENTLKAGTRSADKIPGRIRHYDAVNNVTVVSDTNTGRIITVVNGKVN